MSTKTVLVVDDDLDIREALRDMLTYEGYQISEASDGLSALRHLRTNAQPGLILLDWNMAPMNGREFMAEFARDPGLSSIPVVLLTADLRAQEKAIGNGFVGLLGKPVDIDALFALVARYCA
jgi:CheY-like chemotaxis protein